MTQSAHSGFRTTRTGGLEALQPGSNHRPVWVRWDVALCSRCRLQIRQGEFRIFSPPWQRLLSFTPAVRANDNSSVRGDSESQTSLLFFFIVASGKWTYSKLKWKRYNSVTALFKCATASWFVRRAGCSWEKLQFLNVIRCSKKKNSVWSLFIRVARL